MISIAKVNEVGQMGQAADCKPQPGHNRSLIPSDIGPCLGFPNGELFPSPLPLATALYSTIPLDAMFRNFKDRPGSLVG
jgi:hypothetical protein